MIINTNGELHEPGEFHSVELLTIKDVAELLKISPSSVRRLQQGRHLAFIKVGGSVRFNKRDIVEYLQKGRIAPIG